MNEHTLPTATLADLLRLVEASEIGGTRRRDTISAIKRLSVMMDASPQTVSLNVPSLQVGLAGIRPAAHRVTVKTLSNLKSLLASALEEAGLIEAMPRGIAQHDPAWMDLVAAIAHNKRQANGLATFVNWCSLRGILPGEVSDEIVQSFAEWLLSRTLYTKPKNTIRRVPAIWNEVREVIPGWPDIKLSTISFRAPSKYIRWNDLDAAYRADAEQYLAKRAKPDVFDEHPDAPRRPLAPLTIELQREHLRLCASILTLQECETVVVTSLEQLVEPDAFKVILRHYHEKAKGKPSSSAISISKTLLQVARYHVRVSPEQLSRLKGLAAKLPQIPFDLTAKNKALLRTFDSEQLRARLIWLPDNLITRFKNRNDMAIGKLTLVDSQMAIAIAILLVAPLRPQNLCQLSWRRHFSAPNGRRGTLMLHIPASETKTKKREFIFELPDNVRDMIYWYREKVLKPLGADPDGELFVTYKAVPKHQATLSDQISERLERHLGFRISPHQFRHLAAMFYLEEHPEDFETVRALLGHSYSKTTLIYAGASGQRASRVYGKFVTEQRAALKLKGINKRGTHQKTKKTIANAKPVADVRNGRATQPRHPSSKKGERA